jgi:hypothetical protein
MILVSIGWIDLGFILRHFLSSFCEGGHQACADQKPIFSDGLMQAAFSASPSALLIPFSDSVMLWLLCRFVKERGLVTEGNDWQNPFTA